MIIIHSDHSIVQFRECGLRYAVCDKFLTISNQHKDRERKTTNYPSKPMHIRHQLYIPVLYADKHELNDDKKK